jgi:hypothetical protein
LAPSITLAASSQPPPTSPPNVATKTACGHLDCLAFDSAETALQFLLKQTSPYVLAIGEIHAQKNIPLKASTTHRFAQLLPQFQGTSKHLIIELWTGRNDCGDNRVAKVKEAQKPVTSAQAETNQNEYFELGNRSKELGIFPHALVPSCDDYQAIIAARSNDIAKMLELTALKTKETVETLLRKADPVPGIPYIITYGGALHNDVTPKPGREMWSFGADLYRDTKGHYVELDLIQREQVRDTESFTTLPWYPYFRKEGLESKYALFKMGDSSYALVFPSERAMP